MDVLLLNNKSVVRISLVSEHPMYAMAASLRVRVTTADGFHEEDVDPLASDTTPTETVWEVPAQRAFYKVSALLQSIDTAATGDERVFVRLTTTQKKAGVDTRLEAVWDTYNPERKLTKVGSMKKAGAVVASKTRYRDLAVNIL